MLKFGNPLILKWINQSITPLIFLLVLIVSISAMAGDKIRLALDDLPGVDMLNVLVAVEQSRTRGVDIEIVYLQSEGITVQAISNGQADIGMGTPYAFIQKSNAPIRMFYQLNKLSFHPVINTDYLKNWGDLDGIVMHTHGAGSGTEAIMNMMARRQNIQYSEMKYVPGSGVRANAMLQKRIKATIVDTERRNLLLNSSRGNFSVLPMPPIYATDEALYANQAFIENHQADLKILIEELLNVWRKTNQSPEFITNKREQYQLLPRLSKKKGEQTATYYSEMVEVGAFPDDGGAGHAFAADVEFYGFAGTLSGDINQLKETDFWDFRILREVLNEQ